MGDVIEGEVVRYVPYGVFVRVYDDINGLVHLSEISDKSGDNPAGALKLGQIVKAKIILLEPQNRKIGLSIKILHDDKKKKPSPVESESTQAQVTPEPEVAKPAKTTKAKAPKGEDAEVTAPAEKPAKTATKKSTTTKTATAKKTTTTKKTTTKTKKDE